MEKEHRSHTKNDLVHENKRKRGRPPHSNEINLEHLCDVALKIFAEKGFSGTTTTEITKTAGVSRSLIHYYFGSKEELWNHSVKRLTQQFIAELEESKSEKNHLSEHDLIKLSVRKLVQFYARYPTMLKIFSQEMIEQNSRSEFIMNHFVLPLWEFTGDIFKEARNKGKIKRIHKAFQTSILLGMASNLFVYPYLYLQLYDMNTLDEKVVNEYADVVVEIFCHGIFSTPPSK